MATGVHIKPSGIMAVVQIGEDEDSDTLTDLQSCVGGWIEPVYLKGRYVMYVNEEGLLRGYWPNQKAIEYANKNGLRTSDHYIVGEVVIVGPEDEDGNVGDAPADLIALARKE